jgi:hypothetical protein
MTTTPSPWRIKRSQQPDWKPFKPAMKHYTHIWNRPWPELSKTYKGTRSSRNESQDHPEQLKQFKPWKQPLQFSNENILSRSTKFPNTPPGTDVGDAPQVFTLYPSQIYLSMTSKTNTTRKRSWEKKWRKSSNKIRTCWTKFPKNTECHQRNSRKTPSWLWSPKPWPPTCSSNTTTVDEETLEWKISPCGENHFSKRRSESESYSESKSGNESHRSKSRDRNSKSESKSESKDTKAKSENKLV